VTSVLAVAYVALHAFPQLLFAHSLTTSGITFYSRAPLPPDAAARADEVAALLERCELAVADRHERVFVCDSPWLFGLFSPTSAGAFAFSVPLTDHVFVASADWSRDLASRAAPEFNSRSLSAVVAHEITHGLIRHRLGLLRSVRLPDWVAEGYCDYVADESSFPTEQGLRLFASGERHPSASYRYFTYRLMVRHLVEDQHLSFSQVVARAGEFAAVEAATREALESSELP
jgi:hypothetical protein